MNLFRDGNHIPVETAMQSSRQTDGLHVAADRAYRTFFGRAKYAGLLQLTVENVGSQFLSLRHTLSEFGSPLILGVQIGPYKMALATGPMYFARR